MEPGFYPWRQSRLQPISLASNTAQEHPAFSHFESLQDAGIYSATQFWEAGLKDVSIMT